MKRDENLVDIETDKVVLETPAPDSGVLVEDRQGRRRHRHEQRSHRADRHRSRASPRRRRGRRRRSPRKRSRPPKRRAASARRRGDAGGAEARRREAGRHRGDRRAPAAAGASPRATCCRRCRRGAQRSGRGRQLRAGSRRRQRSARRRRRSISATLGERPEQRVPMSRLRARIAERLVQSQSTAAILTTFNEVNMQPVIDLRKRYQDRFEKEHGVKLGFMSFFVKAAVYALKKYPGRQRVDRRQRHRLPRLLRHRHRGRQPARPGRADHAQRRPARASRTSRSRSPTSASARRTASSRSRS